MPPDERHAYTPADLDAMYREHPVTAIRVTCHELFRWESYQQWVDRAARDFRRARAGRDLPHEGGYICVDAAGYVCEIVGLRAEAAVVNLLGMKQIIAFRTADGLRGFVMPLSYDPELTAQLVDIAEVPRG